MDDSAWLIVVGIFGPIAGAGLGAVAGYYLGKRSTRGASEAERRRNNAESAGALLQEIGRIKTILDDKFPQYIGQAAYWETFPRLPSASYDELHGQGRIVTLGLQLATFVNQIYECSQEINNLTRRIGDKLAEHPEIGTPAAIQANLGEEWREIWSAKSGILSVYAEAERQLRNVV